MRPSRSGCPSPAAHASQHGRLRVLARLGGTLLLLGVAVGVGRWIMDASLDGDGAGGVVITAYFALGGVLFSALGWLGDGLKRPGDMRLTVTPR